MTGVEDLDRQIVRLLASNGRMSYTELGKLTGLSTSAVHQRVRRLEQRGIIKGYAAVVDYEALDLPLTAFISIKPIDPSQPDDSPDLLQDVPEIEDCHSVAGDENYVLKVRVTSPRALEELLARIRSKANVSTRSLIVLSTPYEHRPPAV
ncbi:Lrp/AsnC family transcriptional regulator, leucine-responsive regulatory protein [Actinopolymorpha cephalotaxi]|uniref:Lrp/AsnC family transcriptional regulator, leucine-responsive regulatory protein n=1 Tax=Actinopolymorpha cephalotaxi TaxID=504797 RepID=A0A1I2T229_9ACTN|nr:Lrp/AsnC family transcriptional regulator, leucine-responsive regulatory protein [Actinopolymorpha cephalotaxi]